MRLIEYWAIYSIDTYSMSNPRHFKEAVSIDVPKDLVREYASLKYDLSFETPELRKTNNLFIHVQREEKAIHLTSEAEVQTAIDVWRAVRQKSNEIKELETRLLDKVKKE